MSSRENKRFFGILWARLCRVVGRGASRQAFLNRVWEREKKLTTGIVYKKGLKTIHNEILIF